MIEKLDELDRRILIQLDIDSRRPISKIAKKLKTSKNVVNYRINRLAKMGVIRGYYTVIDTVRLGYYNFRLYLKLREATTQEKDSIIKELTDEKRTWWVARVSSPWDIAVILLAKDLHEANAMADKVLERDRDKIHGYSFVPYVELKHFPKTYLAQTEERPAFTLGNEEKVGISELERNILRELSLNARMGTVEMAKKIGSTPIVVRYAIRKLIKSRVILGFRVLVDYDKINYDYYWVHLNVSSERDRLAAFVQSLPNTVYYDETIGGWDIDFALHISKEEHIDDWLERINEKFGSSITEHMYIRVIKNEKVSYMPQD